jgi:UPF0755 protein
MKTFFRTILLLLFIAVAAGAWAFYQISQPFQGYTGDKFVELAKGTPSRAIASTLQRDGVVKASWMFLAARALHPGAKLQAGEYRFDHPMSALEVYRKIAKGDIFYFVVTVPEGQNMFDIATTVARFGTITEAQFLKAARDASSILDLDPNATTLEGYLWPDTYRIVRTTTAAQLCSAMTHKFRSQWKNLNVHADVHKTVTLASLVEREARIPTDRPLVASVFANRLARGIKLDCDPTTVYAALIEGRYKGTIHKSDLANTNPYNTYQNIGLPPGPIANPGLNSIKAALAPAETNYLFFVAKPDGSGGHTFSESLGQHVAATELYRRGQNH